MTNLILNIILFSLLFLNCYLLAGIQTTLKFMIMRNRLTEARVETLMLESMYSKETP